MYQYKGTSMKKPSFSIPKGLALHALATLCIGFGCAWPLLDRKSVV